MEGAQCLVCSGIFRVGNLPKCDKTTSCRFLYAEYCVLLLRLTFRVTVWQIFCCTEDGSGGVLIETDCGGDPVSCLLRFSMVRNLPKYVCVWVIKNLLPVLVCGIVWQIFCYTGDGSGGVLIVTDCGGDPVPCPLLVLDSWKKNPPLFFSFQAVISFTEACSQQQARTGNFARVRYFHYSPLLRGEEKIILDNEPGSITS